MQQKQLLRCLWHMHTSVNGNSTSVWLIDSTPPPLKCFWKKTSAGNSKVSLSETHQSVLLRKKTPKKLRSTCCYKCLCLWENTLTGWSSQRVMVYTVTSVISVPVAQWTLWTFMWVQYWMLESCVWLRQSCVWLRQSCVWLRQHFNTVITQVYCSVQCAIGTRNHEMTVLV